MKCLDGQVDCLTLTGHLLAQLNDTISYLKQNYSNKNKF